jgi:hypothetical protein
VLHHPLEVAARAFDDRDEVDDGRCADARRPQDGRVGDVAGDELSAPSRQPARTLRVAHERTHTYVARAQRMHDVAADEARAPGDEDRHSKFLK